MTKQIPLTQNQVALVDDSDYERLSQFKWYAWKPGNRRTFYAVRGIALPNGKRGVSYMHREIVNAPSGEAVDHRDGNGINNQRSNLRIATQRQNSYNQSGRKTSTSRFKGVSGYRSRPQWRARIMVNGKEHHLGHFNTEFDAACAYDMAARAHFGEYARLNFPLDISLHGSLVTDADIERAQAAGERDEAAHRFASMLTAMIGEDEMQATIELADLQEGMADNEFWATGQW